jgi:hypothetical protein
MVSKDTFQNTTLIIHYTPHRFSYSQEMQYFYHHSIHPTALQLQKMACMFPLTDSLHLDKSYFLELKVTHS